MQTLELLLRYPQFRSLLLLFAALCWAMTVVLAMVALAHTLAAIGRRSFIYKQPPTSGWSKRFYPACCMLAAVLAVIALWMQRLAATSGI